MSADQFRGGPHGDLRVRSGWVTVPLADLDRPQGGNIQRMGANRVLIFKGESQWYPWIACMFVPEMETTAFGAAWEPREAHANLIRTLLGWHCKTDVDQFETDGLLAVASKHAVAVYLERMKGKR